VPFPEGEGAMDNNAAGCTVNDAITLMEGIAPPHLAEEWDNCGLQLGSRLWPVKKILVALDPTVEVMQAAADQGVDLVITHHPLLFRPVKSIDLDTPLGRIVSLAITTRTALYSAHTNLDSAQQGVNDILAETIGLTELSVLVPQTVMVPNGGQTPLLGLGRVGRMTPSMSLDAFAKHVKHRLHLPAVKMAGNPAMMVEQVAVCSGSGSGLLADFLGSAAQVYVSGDLRYHDARTIEEAQRAMIDVGHFPSEQIIIDRLVELLRAASGAAGLKVQVEPCRVERDPFLLV